jgi:hypothetical protein
MRGPAAALLAFESIVALLAGLLAATGSDASNLLAWTMGAGLAVVCIAGAATMRRGPGWVIGSIAQVLALASGFVVPAMFFLGAVFGGLWILAYVLDRRLADLAATRQ